MLANPSSTLERSDPSATRTRRPHGSADRSLGELAGGLFLALAPFVLIAYLSLEGGGFDAVLFGRLGIAIWWLALLGGILGVLSLTALPRAAKIAIATLAAFAIWTGLSMLWSESADRSAQELARASSYLGVLVLFLVAQTRGRRHLTLGSVAAGIGFVAVIALLSRMEPELFPKNETLDLVGASEERLNYPLNYWNGLAGLLAIGAPLLVFFAGRGRTTVTKTLAVAVLPALGLAVYLTLSRGGALALAVGLVGLAALYPRRRELLPGMLIGGLATAGLIWAARAREGFADGIRVGDGLVQGDEMLAITIVVCALAGLAQLLLANLRGRLRPVQLPRPPRRAKLVLAGGLVAALIAVALVADLPGEVGDAWEQFKQSDVTRGSDRLASASGNGRYQWWASALEANASAPVLGIGAGTFQFWWAREGPIPSQVVDSHSLYLESLAELGIVGLVLIVAFVGGSLLLIGRRARRGPDLDQRILAAAAGSVAAFAAAAATDWVWELPVLPVALMIVVGAALGGRGPGTEPGAGGRGRLLLVAVAVAGVVAIAPALLGADAIRASQERVSAGDLDAALADAERASRFEPYSGAAALQKALVLELQGKLGRAAAAAREATSEESTNWETWLVLSRIEVERGRSKSAIDAFRESREMNPNSGLFQETSAGDLAPG